MFGCWCGVLGGCWGEYVCLGFQIPPWKFFILQKKKCLIVSIFLSLVFIPPIPPNCVVSRRRHLLLAFPPFLHLFSCLFACVCLFWCACVCVYVCTVFIFSSLTFFFLVIGAEKNRRLKYFFLREQKSISPLCPALRGSFLQVTPPTHIFVGFIFRFVLFCFFMSFINFAYLRFSRYLSLGAFLGAQKLRKQQISHRSPVGRRGRTPSPKKKKRGKKIQKRSKFCGVAVWCFAHYEITLLWSNLPLAGVALPFCLSTFCLF